MSVQSVSAPPVTLQISLVPADLEHAVHTLPHQLRQWGDQVSEIVFVVDRKRDDLGSVLDVSLRVLLTELCATHPGARIEYVDHYGSGRTRVAKHFTGRPRMPARDYRSGPIYGFLFGLEVAQNDFVLHADSDMLFGGGSHSWVQEGLALLAARPDALAVSPLPGPPTADGRIPDDVARRHALAHPPDSAGPGLQPRREPLDSLAYRFSGISWRAFLMDRHRVLKRLVPIPLRHARPRQFALALLDRNEPWATLEHSMSHAMLERGLYRIDFSGQPPGVWSLHPPYRSREFYRDLPALINRVETGDIPREQLGDYELGDSLVDWTAAREAKRRRRCWRRIRARSSQSRVNTSSRSGWPASS